MAVFQLIYMSSLVNPDPEQVRGILDVAVRNNKQRDITGMLLLADGNVVQVLEGEKSAVLATFESIRADKRHTGILTLIQEEIASRQFAAWSMGFRQLSESDLKAISVASSFFKAQLKEIELRVRPGDALTILKSFADGSIGHT